MTVVVVGGGVLGLMHALEARLEARRPARDTLACTEAMQIVAMTMGQSRIDVFRDILGDEATAQQANNVFEERYAAEVAAGRVTALPAHQRRLSVGVPFRWLCICAAAPFWLSGARSESKWRWRRCSRLWPEFGFNRYPARHSAGSAGHGCGSGRYARGSGSPWPLTRSCPAARTGLRDAPEIMR
ncbi:MAG: phosphoglycolate phosphatase [Streptosporangiaceae bacterium]|jgi:hypothetical protein|nr:phosphoglycolate phosphatase [Streptosporangiaceae bacterium]